MRVHSGIYILLFDNTTVNINGENTSCTSNDYGKNHFDYP